MFSILNPLLPPSPYHPSGSSQCTSPKHPVSCIKPELVIHFLYDIIYVSMPFSPSSHSFPVPQSPKDYAIHLCLFCHLAYRDIVTIFLNSIYISTLFSIVAVLACLPTHSPTGVRGFPFLHSPAFIVCRIFDGSHSGQHEMVPHCSFDLHFSDNE